MYKIFAELLQKNHIKAADVCRATGLPSSLFSEWKRGKSSPKIDKLQRIADYFNVPVSYFFSEDENAETQEKPTLIESELSERDKEILKLIRSLSPENRILAEQMIEALVNKK